MIPPPPSSTLFPYTTLFRSIPEADERYPAKKEFARRVAALLNEQPDVKPTGKRPEQVLYNLLMLCAGLSCSNELARSEEHTSELQSRENLVCRLLLEKKKTK